MIGAPASFHFLGICGTAMGSVAAALRESGFAVTGSDENIFPPMSTFLESRGITLHKSPLRSIEHGVRRVAYPLCRVS